MPPPKESNPEKSIGEIVLQLGRYPLEAFEFVQHGLSFTVQKLHGQCKDPTASRHVSGRDLSEGLRELALMQWGLLARTVLSRWNITCTDDFGRIVFAMVDNGYMQKTEQDNPDDFRGVFDFTTAFEQGYRIESKA